MTQHPVLLLIFIVANVVIASAYIYLALTVMRRINVRLLSTRIGGIGFFGLCGLTHLEMAYNALAHSNVSFGMMDTSWYMLAIHVPQAVCVWMFVTGLYVEVDSWDTGRNVGPASSTRFRVRQADRHGANKAVLEGKPTVRGKPDADRADDDASSSAED